MALRTRARRSTTTRRASRALRAGLGLVGIGLLAVGACSTDDDPIVEGTGGAASGPYSSTECGTCVAEACSNAFVECQTDPGCAGYLDCLLQCPTDEHGNADNGCDEACQAVSSSETAELIAGVAACRFYGDGASCPTCAIPTTPISGPLNQQCEPRPEPAPDPCRQCYWDHCCDTWDACYAEGVNPDCAALGACISSCPEPVEPCVQGCFDEHPESISGVLDEFACASAFCALDTDHCDPAERTSECVACIYEDCGDPFAQLVATADGFLAWLCTADCGGSDEGPECIAACVVAHPESEDAYWLWAQCLSYRCGTLC